MEDIVLGSKLWGGVGPVGGSNLWGGPVADIAVAVDCTVMIWAVDWAGVAAPGVDLERHKTAELGF